MSINTIDSGAIFKISYGLYVVTAKNSRGDNGCIINTAAQLTSNPTRISITVNKSNYTHDMIMDTGEFNVSVLTTEAPFDLFRKFGFQSGKDTDKFEGEEILRAANGIAYISKYTNAYISGRLVHTVDCGTHTIFIAEVTEAKVLSDKKSVTYEYYFENIKPKPEEKSSKKKGYVCKICGYVYEGETLPEDFVCPLCKHGAEDFEPLS